MATGQAVNARERLLAGVPVIERRVGATAVLEGGDGPPVVLLHGPLANATHWARVIPGLVATHRVIAPDLPGHGESEMNGDPVAWLGELIARTCATPPAVVGHALGAAIAAGFAAEHGDRIARLVLVDALGLAEFQPTPEFGAALQRFVTDPTERTHDELWRYCAHDAGGLRARMDSVWDQFRAYNLDRVRTPSVAAAAGTLMEQYGMAEIAPARLARIDVATTLIWGRHDLATGLAVAEAASARHGWPLRVIEDCADDPPVEQPEALVRALRGALADAAALAAAGFGGEVVDRSHPRYDELRKVFNGMIDRRPALIARCTDARDVSAAVNFAREHRLPVSVYGGGHNITGNAVCEDGVTIDLRPMKRIEIDLEARTCRADAGLTWGELDAATQEHGLAVTGGRVSTTGLGGLVLGGGSGWLERKYGYAVDNLLSLETVTADGRIVTASAREHPDLFWGSRGGGGNFGAVTSFEFQLHPVGPIVLAGMLVYPAERAPAVLRNFRAAAADAPDEVGSAVALLCAPDLDFIPEHLRGERVIALVLCYAGPVEEGEEALRPLREFGPPALDMVQPMPYVALQQMLDGDYPHGMRNYWTGDFLTDLPDEAIEVMCRFQESCPSPHSATLLLPGGGAPARVPDGSLAIGQRLAPFNIHITSLWEDPAADEANIAWTRAFRARLKPFATGRVYVNFIGDEGREGVVASFGTEGYRRMQKIKRAYDPENLFRSNQNVVP